MDKIISNGQEMLVFANRREAGEALAQVLKPYAAQKPVIVGLAHGGVVVALEVARLLKAPLFALNVRKIGAPGEPELALGAKVVGQPWPQPEVKGRTAIIVDDGAATGYTALAAIQYLKKRFAEKLVFAAPVCAAESAGKLSEMVSQIVCLEAPVNLSAVGYYYRNFSQVSDEEVGRLLEEAKTYSRGYSGE